jgi:hypothetical protein
MLTVAHVVDDKGLTAGTQRAPVKVLRIDPEKDLALLLVAIPCPCANISIGDSPAIDEAIIMVGYPLHSYTGAQTITEGRVQGITKEGRLLTTANIAPGNSGGGVFVKVRGNWRLIGIARAVTSFCFGPFQCQLFTHLSHVISTEMMWEFLSGRSPAELDAVKSAPLPDPLIEIQRLLQKLEGVLRDGAGDV